MSHRTTNGNVASGRGPGKRVGSVLYVDIRAAIKAGVLSYAEIALEHGVSKRTVQRYADDLRANTEPTERHYS